MKITKIKYNKERVPLTRPYKVAYENHTAVDIFFVEIQTNSGKSGFGCGTPSEYVTGETPEITVRCLEKLSQVITGDPRHLGRHCRELLRVAPEAPAARAAIDIALHDLFCKELGIPLVEFFGVCHKSLKTSITIGIKSLEEILTEAKEYIGRGFQAIKLKIGDDIEEDIERVAKMRELLGEQIALRVDANQGYNLLELQEFFTRTQNYNIELIEQPLTPDQDQELAQVPSEKRHNLCADESVRTPVEALKLCGPLGLYGIFNIKLMKSGGLHQSKKIAEIAQLRNIPIMWGCMDESVHGIAAALHLAFASPNTKYLDLDGSLDLSWDFFSGGFEIKDGIMRPIQGSGLATTHQP